MNTATPTEPMGTGHKCRNCSERVSLVYDRGSDVTHWVHDRTGENYCADRAISARPVPEKDPKDMTLLELIRDMRRMLDDAITEMREILQERDAR